MPVPLELLVDSLQLRPQPFRDRDTPDPEPPRPGCRADMRKPQEVERLRSTRTTRLPKPGSVPPELDQPRLVRVQLQPEPRQPLAKLVQEPPRILKTATDGWYALLTNLKTTEADAAEVFRRYKGQEAVERRHQAFKGPLAVSPLFIHTNRRITAMITVICLALLIFCLVERTVRQAIAPATKLDGLYAASPAKPTGRLIFEALANLRMIPAHNGSPPTIPQPSDLQIRLFEILNVDPRRPR
jgi:hypothetical protein